MIQTTTEFETQRSVCAGSGSSRVMPIAGRRARPLLATRSNG